MNRRDFLKISALITLGNLPFFRGSYLANQETPNIILIVLDSLSAKNMSLHGYRKETTPNLEKFSQQATVFHRHYTPGTFTPPGTASLLTGTVPATHRVIRVMGRLPQNLEKNNIFETLKSAIFTASYTQNLQAEMLLQQFRTAIDIYTPIQETAEIYQQLFAYPFNRDLPAAYWGERISRGENTNFRGSIYLSGLADLLQELIIWKTEQNYSETYREGLPHNYQGMAYLPEYTFSWLEKNVQKLPAPFFGYYHFYPPHHPFRASEAFKGIFEEKWTPPQKPISIFSTEDDIAQMRIEYDEFIAETDYLLGKALTNLEESGLLENSYLIITSDHGEMVERGIWGHLTPTLYEPLVNIPLIIRSPGQKSREDIYIPTSSIDILPTLCKITNQPIPNWAEGEVLPTFTLDNPDPERAIYVMDFKDNQPQEKFKSGSIALIKNQRKLIHYFGYEKIEHGFEFYNLAEDPEELADLYPDGDSEIKDMEKELLRKKELFSVPNK